MENLLSIFLAPLKTVTLFARPLLKRGNVLHPHSVWLKLQAPVVSPPPPLPHTHTFCREKQGAQAGLKILKYVQEFGGLFFVEPAHILDIVHCYRVMC